METCLISQYTMDIPDIPQNEFTHVPTTIISHLPWQEYFKNSLYPWIKFDSLLFDSYDTERLQCMCAYIFWCAENNMRPKYMQERGVIFITATLPYVRRYEEIRPKTLPSVCYVYPRTTVDLKPDMLWPRDLYVDVRASIYITKKTLYHWASEAEAWVKDTIIPLHGDFEKARDLIYQMQNLLEDPKTMASPALKTYLKSWIQLFSEKINA